MRAENFEFDGMDLSYYSMMVVSFDGKFSNFEKVTNGAEVEMNVVSVLNGTESHWVGSRYKEVVSTTFQIAKFVEGQFCEITLDEYRTLMHWLGTKQPSKFKLLTNSIAADNWLNEAEFTDISFYNCLYWNGIFNKIVAITLGSKIVGLELTFTATTPFAYHEPILRQKTVAVGQVFSVLSNSDEDGNIYGWASDVCSRLSEMVNNSDLFSIPNIQLSNAPSPTAAERALQKMDTDIELMEGIVFVSQHTHNSFSDVMKMPYLVFQSHLKHIHLSQLLENKEWREKYLQAKYEIESKKPENQSLSRNKKNPDMDGLMRLGGLING